MPHTFCDPILCLEAIFFPPCEIPPWGVGREEAEGSGRGWGHYPRVWGGALPEAQGERTYDLLVMSEVVLMPGRSQMVGLSHSPQIVLQPEPRRRKGTKGQSAHTAGTREGDGGLFGAIS